MSGYAIDVVILPPEPLMDLAISWNRHLATLDPQDIHLDKTSTLPHISLLMGCIGKADLPHAKALLAQAAKSWSPIPITVTGIQYTAASHPVAALDVALSERILQAQRELIEIFNPLFRQAGEADLFDPPPIRPSSVEWINRFIQDQSGERFWPHITLGHGRMSKVQEEATFVATRIAIAHLGNHCTCRSILAEVSLRG